MIVNKKMKIAGRKVQTSMFQNACDETPSANAKLAGDAF